MTRISKHMAAASASGSKACLHKGDVSISAADIFVNEPAFALIWRRLARQGRRNDSRCPIDTTFIRFIERDTSHERE